MPPTPASSSRADGGFDRSLDLTLLGLAALPGVSDRVDAAREACTRLRFDETLRRRIPEAAAESRVRGARASAMLEGAELPLDRVRDVVRGASSWGSGPVDVVGCGAVQATAETEHLAGLAATAPLQVLARLHVAATANVLPQNQVGRPRTGDEDVRELVDLGRAPGSAEVTERLAGVARLLTADLAAPSLVVAAIVHAEIATVRPFVRGNGIVARAMERLVIQASGLDPTGVAVPEVGHGAGGGPAYLGALAAYGTGRPEGVALWLQHCADAVEAGAQEGLRICAAVRAGRLS